MDDTKARYLKLKAYLAEDPDNFNLLHEVIDLSLSVSSADETEILLERLFALAPAHPRTLFQQAMLDMSQCRFGCAEKVFADLYAEYPDNQGVSYNLALCHVMQGRFQEAEPILETLHGSQGRFIRGDILYIRVLHHLGRVNHALALAKQILMTHPDDPDVLGIYSLLLMDNNEVENAVPFAKKALSLKPSNLEALSVLGAYALESFDTEDAKRYFDTAINVQPSDGRSWMGRGLAALIEKDSAMGEACLEKALLYMPDHLGTWNALAWVRIMNGRISGAEQAIIIAMEKDRTFSENHGTLAVIHILEGRRDLARESIKRALRLDVQCYSANFAQILLLDPESDRHKIQERIETLIRQPIVVGGSTIEKGLQSFFARKGG